MSRRAVLCVLSVAVVAPTWAQETFAPSEEPLRVQGRRASGPVIVDGRLDEPDWTATSPAASFRQIEPAQGAPATHDTEVRVLFDAENLYVGARCHDTLGEDAVRARNLRRDFEFRTDDVFGVSFDTFRDGRNAIVFETNPWGARRDQEVLDSDLQDLQWDGAWRVRTVRGPSGWTAEMAIPWKVLRYPAHAREWGVNFVRVIRRLNEMTGWSPWPRAFTPYRMSYAGLLVDLEPPPPSTNVRVQPYAVGREHSAGGSALEEGRFDLGGDVKWALTPGTVLDLTVNTDFAQADADRQVVNLTRFSVLFPEQRPFFQESAALFAAGLEGSVRPFFSRRIGLNAEGFPIPLQAGVRLSHRSGQRSAGALLVRQDSNSGYRSSTFAVGRYVENFGREGRVGVLLTSRFDQGAGEVTSLTNTTATADAFVRPASDVYVKAMVSGSLTSGASGDGVAASLDIARQGNRFSGGWLQEYVGPDYLPATGFLARPDLIRAHPGFTLDLRPAWRPSFIRRLIATSFAHVYHRASDGRFQEAQWFVSLLAADFSNGGWFLSYLVPNWQSLEVPFSPLPGLRVEPGQYQFNRYLVSTSTDTSRRFVARADFEAGPFYDGRSESLFISTHASPSPRLALSFAYTLNALHDIGKDRADRTTHLIAPIVRLALDPDLQLTLFYQRNTAARLSTWNARVSWEFRPLSFVYLVYNERAPLAAISSPFGALPPKDRQLILKVTFNKQF